MRRLLILLTMLTAVLAVFGARAAMSGDSRESAPYPAARPTTATERLASLEQAAADRPDDIAVLAQLATAYVQRVRETGDPSYHALADTASQRALALDPDDPNALVVAGAIAASKHDFQAALMYGERARQLEPTLIAAYSVIVDALVELGRYDEAVAAAQAMADLRPDFAALSRVSYLRELHGDLDGAIDAMEKAVAAGTGYSQDAVWALVIVGDLHLRNGDLTAAQRAYERGSTLLPDAPIVLAGLARLSVARADYPEAEGLLRRAIEQQPLPEYLATLGDILAIQGRTLEAEEHYATVRAIQRLFAANGVDTDIELALFDADHGGDAEAAYLQARAVHQRRPGIYTADVLAWTAYKSGRIAEAQTHMAEALRLGTRDPRLAYHAAVIAYAAGDADGAWRHRREAERMQFAQTVLYLAGAP